MNLAAIVSTAFAALPAGIAGSATWNRPSTMQSQGLDPSTELPYASAPVVAAIANIPVVLDALRRDRVLPEGVTIDRARIATLPAEPFGVYAPLKGDTLTIGGVVWVVVESAPVDPTGAVPALYDVLVHR